MAQTDDRPDRRPNTMTDDGPSSNDEKTTAASDRSAMLCDEWFERSVHGDVAAFESLYRYLHGPLREFAESYLRSRETAEEIVQDVFLAVWQGRETLRLRRSVKGYFYIAVKNRALNEIKRGKVQQRSSELIMREESDRVAVNPAEEQITRDELVAAVQRLIDQLPPRMREAYTLYYQHDLSYAEIATVMGTAVKTVENQLARALRTICAGLGETR
jgi:RNA polymerase sigma-70 factor, ECF subfamily